MKNAVFGKVMKNMGKNINIKLVTTEARRNYLVLVPNDSFEYLLAIQIEKAQIFINKPVYLVL